VKVVENETILFPHCPRLCKIDEKTHLRNEKVSDNVF